MLLVHFPIADSHFVIQPCTYSTVISYWDDRDHGMLSFSGLNNDPKTGPQATWQYWLASPKCLQRAPNPLKMFLLIFFKNYTD